MKKEEFDTSDLAWETYELFYGKNFNIITDSSGRKTSRLHIGGMDIAVSGDTDFNFGPGWSNSIFNKFKGYLGEIPDDFQNQYNSRLEKCKLLYKTIVNISLMPQSGNLQLVKSGVGNDRFDTYIWALNSYYEGETSLLFNRATFQNTEILKKYIDGFKTGTGDPIRQYCHKIYGIPIGSQLVDELISSGKEAIDSPIRVIDYMNLAYKFWQQKSRYIKSLFNPLVEKENPLKKEIEEVDNILDRWFE